MATFGFPRKHRKHFGDLKALPRQSSRPAGMPLRRPPHMRYDALGPFQLLFREYCADTAGSAAHVRNASVRFLVCQAHALDNITFGIAPGPLLDANLQRVRGVRAMHQLWHRLFEVVEDNVFVRGIVRCEKKIIFSRTCLAASTSTIVRFTVSTTAGALQTPLRSTP